MLYSTATHPAMLSLSFKMAPFLESPSVLSSDSMPRNSSSSLLINARLQRDQHWKELPLTRPGKQLCKHRRHSVPSSGNSKPGLGVLVKRPVLDTTSCKKMRRRPLCGTLAIWPLSLHRPKSSLPHTHILMWTLDGAVWEVCEEWRKWNLSISCTDLIF